MDKRSCTCGGNCHDNDSHLPGLLLAGLGIVAIPLNAGVISGFNFSNAWPFLLLLFGVVFIAKPFICKKFS